MTDAPKKPSKLDALKALPVGGVARHVVRANRRTGDVDSQFVGVRMPVALVRRIDAYAVKANLSASAAIRALIEKGLAETRPADRGTPT